MARCPSLALPYLGTGSDTYHMWAMIGAFNYFLYAADEDFLVENWSRYIKAADYLVSKITDEGVFTSSSNQDWGRYIYSTQSSSPNILLYRTLLTGAALASWLPDELVTTTNYTWTYLDGASSLQIAIVNVFWDEDAGAFRDSAAKPSLYPQDANSMALAFGIVSSNATKAEQISDYLVSRWTLIGPTSPELPGNISPFISSIELEGHYRIGRADRAVELTRSLWGWYQNHPNGTQSTVVEGYLADGTFAYRATRGYRNDASYTSHAHGWSSGPTSTMTEWLVGLRVTKLLGSEWQLSPSGFNSDLTQAEAGFATSLGKFWAKWTVGTSKVKVRWSTPEGTKGLIAIPGQDAIWVNGGEGSVSVSL